MDLYWVIAALVAGIGGFLAGTKRWQNKYQEELLKGARLEAQIEAQDKAHNEKIAALTAIRGEIESNLKNIATTALSQNQSDFLQLANQNFQTHKQNAEAELEARKIAVENLVTPINESLKAYKLQIDALEQARSTSFGSISEELRNVVATQNAVRTETSKLVNALRAAPKTRGRWGEHTLRNVLELAGLSQHCDFNTEETFKRDNELLRPDVIISLPGERKLVIDAKTPLSAYLDAVDAVDEEERNRCLTLHVKHVRDHVKQLSGKTYWDGLTVTPDFVVMFIPGDNFYTAAVERDPSLFEDAAKQRVVIVTPATLIALAKAVAYGWRQEKVAENAKKVHDAGRELYKRLTTMGKHIVECGKAISKSAESYNKFIGSLEQSVMPQARRFNELEVEGTATEIAILEQIEQEPRILQSTDFTGQESKVAVKAL
ncbi:MAG: DNA recombination protein RmuC [Pseudomonadota bacterium]|nr:DNA recombination protein RmuC [Pseudomonadota bacterium]MDE3036905.1 DNA recombination protein RmuC [Pseudomonadota bacterium]